MSEMKPNPARSATASSLFLREGRATNLRLQLQKEIDALALLIEQVKRQSDRVQAVADAIADKILMEAPRLTYSKGRRSAGIKSANAFDERAATPISDSSSALL